MTFILLSVLILMLLAIGIELQRLRQSFVRFVEMVDEALPYCGHGERRALCPYFHAAGE